MLETPSTFSSVNTYTLASSHKFPLLRTIAQNPFSNKVPFGKFYTLQQPNTVDKSKKMPNVFLNVQSIQVLRLKIEY